VSNNEEPEVGKTLTRIVVVSIVMSGITYIWESVVSPTKNVLVFSIPSKTEIFVPSVEFKNEYNPTPSSIAVKLSLV
jgi:hypothetical protein